MQIRRVWGTSIEMHRAPPGWIHPKVHTSADAAFAQPQCHPRRRVLEKVKTLNQNLWTLGSMGWNGMGYTAGTGVATALMNFQCLTYWHAIVLCGRLQTFHCCEERPTPAPQRHLQENGYGWGNRGVQRKQLSRLARQVKIYLYALHAIWNPA